MNADFDNLRDIVRVAAGRGEVREAVEAVYADLAREVAAQRPRCDVSGRCCRFEEYGHRLYVSTMELAAFVHGLGTGGEPGAARRAWDGTGCPFQMGKVCGVHGIRPMGCRIYYCDPASTAWQHDAYERLHARLRQLHDELGVPYLYVEWRAALGALGLATPDKPAEALSSEADSL